jgi:hypothetical protein
MCSLLQIDLAEKTHCWKSLNELTHYFLIQIDGLFEVLIFFNNQIERPVFFLWKSVFEFRIQTYIESLFYNMRHDLHIPHGPILAMFATKCRQFQSCCRENYNVG